MKKVPCSKKCKHVVCKNRRHAAYEQKNNPIRNDPGHLGMSSSAECDLCDTKISYYNCPDGICDPCAEKRLAKEIAGGK